MDASTTRIMTFRYDVDAILWGGHPREVIRQAAVGLLDGLVAITKQHTLVRCSCAPVSALGPN